MAIEWTLSLSNFLSDDNRHTICLIFSFIRFEEWPTFFRVSKFFNSIGKQALENPIFINPVIIYLSEKGWVKPLRYLFNIQTYLDPSIQNNQAIQLACKNGHKEIVKILLGRPQVDPSVGQNKALRVASKHGHGEIVKILLKDKRVDPTVDHNYALLIACHNGYTSVVEALLDDGRVDPTALQNYAYNEAVRNKHVSIVALLHSRMHANGKCTHNPICPNYSNSILMK